MDRRVFNSKYFSTSDDGVELRAVDVNNLSKSRAHNDAFLMKSDYCTQWKWVIVKISDYINTFGER